MLKHLLHLALTTLVKLLGLYTLVSALYACGGPPFESSNSSPLLIVQGVNDGSIQSDDGGIPEGAAEVSLQDSGILRLDSGFSYSDGGSESSGLDSGFQDSGISQEDSGKSWNDGSSDGGIDSAIADAVADQLTQDSGILEAQAVDSGIPKDAGCMTGIYCNITAPANCVSVWYNSQSFECTDTGCTLGDSCMIVAAPGYVGCTGRMECY